MMVVGETGNVDAAIAIDYVKEEREEINMVFHFANRKKSGSEKCSRDQGN